MMDALTGAVLIVEDEFLIAEMLSESVEEMGMRVVGTADTAHGAVALAERHRPDLVLMDVRLKGREDGVDAALSIHYSVGCPVIFITGSREPATQTRIREDHPADILIKPITLQQLRTSIERALG